MSILPLGNGNYAWTLFHLDVEITQNKCTLNTLWHKNP